MRTVGEIIEAVKDAETVTLDEARFALLAVCALHYFASNSLRKLAHEPSKFRTVESEAEEEFKRSKAFFANDAQKCVGWNNDPANPEYQRFRRMGKKLIEKAIEKANL